MAATVSKLHRFRTEDAALVPPDYTDGPAAHRLPIGDALYCAWILGNMRLMGCRCYGVSQVMDALGGDEEMTALGALGFVERWKVNQVTLYYWGPLLDLMLECNPGMPEADVAPARAWATVRRSGFYYYLGAAGDGALLYDAFEDLLFAAKGLMSAIPFLLEQQMGLGGAGAPPLLRRRVQIGGLGARPELNGELALAMAFDASAGRYTVILEQTGECVRVRPANLTRTAEDGEAASLLYLTLLPFEGAIVYDGVIAAPDGGGANRQWNASFTRAWTEGPGRSWAAKVNDAAAELRRRDPIRALLPEHAQLICSRWRGGLATHMGANMPAAIRGQTLFLPGELEFVPPEEVGPVTSTPEAANVHEWWSAE